METLYLLIPVGLIFLGIAIKLLFWAINSGQYDDLETESQRILFDDVKPPADTSPSNDISKKTSDS